MSSFGRVSADNYYNRKMEEKTHRKIAVLSSYARKCLITVDVFTIGEIKEKMKYCSFISFIVLIFVIKIDVYSIIKAIGISNEIRKSFGN